jgi:hypothetical protein
MQKVSTSAVSISNGNQLRYCVQEREDHQHRAGHTRDHIKPTLVRRVAGWVRWTSRHAYARLI